jgi:hypothetical protein
MSLSCKVLTVNFKECTLFLRSSISCSFSPLSSPHKLKKHAPHRPVKPGLTTCPAPLEQEVGPSTLQLPRCQDHCSSWRLIQTARVDARRESAECVSHVFELGVDARRRAQSECVLKLHVAVSLEGKQLIVYSWWSNGDWSPVRCHVLSQQSEAFQWWLTRIFPFNWRGTIWHFAFWLVFRLAHIQSTCMHESFSCFRPTLSLNILFDVTFSRIGGSTQYKASIRVNGVTIIS